jgi:hypothetical protein
MCDQHTLDHPYWHGVMDMRYVRKTILFLICCSACGRENRSNIHAPDSTASAVGARNTGSAVQVDSLRASDTRRADTSVADARSIIQDYYAAVNTHAYMRAYLLWSDSGRASHQTFDAFQRGYQTTDSVHVEIGTPSRIEAAMGSRYITIPVRVTAWTGNDIERFAGTYVLRRAVVPGATWEQREWRIYSAHVRRVSS